MSTNIFQSLPNDYEGRFEEIGFFNGLYKIYNIPRNKEKPWQHPQFFGHIINKYVYIPLDIVITDRKVESLGIMKELLKEKRDSNPGTTFYAFIQKIGITKFFGHIGFLVRLMQKAKDKKEFDDLFFNMLDFDKKEFNKLKIDTLKKLKFPDEVLELAFYDLKTKSIKKKKT